MHFVTKALQNKFIKLKISKLLNMKHSYDDILKDFFLQHHDNKCSLPHCECQTQINIHLADGGPDFWTFYYMRI